MEIQSYCYGLEQNEIKALRLMDFLKYIQVPTSGSRQLNNCKTHLFLICFYITLFILLNRLKLYNLQVGSECLWPTSCMYVSALMYLLWKPLYVFSQHFAASEINKTVNNSSCVWIVMGFILNFGCFDYGETKFGLFNEHDRFSPRFRCQLAVCSSANAFNT